MGLMGWRRPRVWLALGATGLAMTLAGCGDIQQGAGQGRYLGLPEPASDRAPAMGDLYMGSWYAAFIVGALVLGILIYSLIRYRRRDPNEV